MNAYMHQGRITQRPYQSADGSPARGGSSRESQTERKTSLTRQLHGSRICSGQSLQEPQISIARRAVAATHSIESTSFRSLSTDFHKQWDLLWEQRVVSSNLTAPTISRS